MRVCILGLHGMIGTGLASALFASGHQVVGTSRAAEAKPDLRPRLTDYHCLKLGQKADPTWFRNCDAVFYLAHDFSPKAAESNLSGTRDWYHSAVGAGVPRHLFFTSYSAKPGSRSTYGAVKFALETFFRSRNQWVLRPGLVAGDRGLFSLMLRLVRRLPILPVLDGGKDPVALISLGSVCLATERILCEESPGEWNLHHPQVVSMLEILQTMRRVMQTRCLFVPFPSFIPLSLLRLTRFLGIRLPLSADSIAAMRENRHIRRPSHLPRLGIEDPPLEEQIRRLAAKASQ
ncbi:MAG TPA: NAD(P)-dependent oxidoreductase [Candidatus Aminicenantes bacterium]|nr:NAD(P)-dependent oxidoreductase [Candidatus Aminicenantes bacterium]